MCFKWLKGLLMPEEEPKLMLPLLKSVQLPRVTKASVVVGMLENQRDLRGAAARRAVSLVQQFQGNFVDQDNIQPWTWDFDKNMPMSATPLVFMLGVIEVWHEWRTNWRGTLVYQRYEHINTLSVYEVRDADVFHARQYQGSVYAPIAAHSNSIEIERETLKEIINGLGL